MGLEKLRKASQERQKEWGKGQEFSLSFRGVELGGEAGEVLNEIKKIERHRMGIAGGKETLDDLKDEIGDVIICLDLIAGDLGIDLFECAKNKFNKTSEKHGFQTRID